MYWRHPWGTPRIQDGGWQPFWKMTFLYTVKFQCQYNWYVYIFLANVIQLAYENIIYKFYMIWIQNGRRRPFWKNEFFWKCHIKRLNRLVFELFSNFMNYNRCSMISYGNYIIVMFKMAASGHFEKYNLLDTWLY